MKQKTRISKLTVILLITILMSLLFPKLITWIFNTKTTTELTENDNIVSQNQILGTLSTLLSIPLLNSEKKRVAEICNSFFEFPDITRIIVLDERNQTVIYEREMKDQPRSKVITSRKQIISQYNTIGNVTMESSPSPISMGINKNHWNYLYILMTELLLSLSLISLIVYHYILLPLFNMPRNTLKDKGDTKKRFLFGFSMEELNEDITTVLKRFKTYRTLVDHSVIVLKVDGNCRIQYITKALCSISGYSEKELMNKNLEMLLLNKTELDHIKDKLIGVRKTTHTNHSIQCVDKDEKLFWLACSITCENQDENNYTFQCENITDKKELALITVTDKLTGLINRKRIDEILMEKIDLFTRYDHVFSIIILDIDRFKEINRVYGHQSGDTVLKEIADLIRNYCRETDLVGRWEGEEFLIICPNTRTDSTRILAENLRKKIEGHSFRIAGNVTASFGISEIKKEDSTSESLIKRADFAISKAKETGRNRVNTD